MILNDTTIQAMLDTGLVSYAEAGQINPASLNIRLGYTYLRPKIPQTVTLGGNIEYRMEELRGRQTTTIMPGEFILATTLERFVMPDNVAAFVQGRSSIGRIGLVVQNAGFVDPGFYGHITLELKNDSYNPIVLRPGYPVAQMVFFETEAVSVPYHGKYNGQIEATGSRMEAMD